MPSSTLATEGQTEKLWGSPYIPLLLVLGGAIACFAFVKHLWFGANPFSPWLALGVTAAVSIIGFPLKSGDIAPAGRIFYRTITIFFGFYVAYISEGTALASHPSGAGVLDVIRIFVPVLALASWHRPSLALVPLCGLLWVKHVYMAVYNLSISYTDWVIVHEIVQFYLLGLILWRLGHRGMPPAILHKEKYDFTELFLFVVIAAHFGNYFYSGLAKIFLNGGPLSWVLENQTWWLMVFTHHAGLLPVDHIPWLRDGLFVVFQKLLVPGNLFILLTQIGCLFLFRWKMALVAILVLFDISHLLIFATTGIFFWKWILLNTVMVFALGKVKNIVRLPWLVTGACMVMTLASVMIFYIVALRWYDTPAATMGTLTAITKDGREVPVPSNYFRALSIHVAQMDYAVLSSQVFENGSWGSTMDYAFMKKAENNCAVFVRPDGPVNKEHWQSFEKVIRLNRAYILSRLDKRGRFDYDFYPHHIWSNPWLYKAFSHLDKRQIQAYRVDIKAVCLPSNLKDAPRLIAKKSFMLSLGPE